MARIALDYDRTFTADPELFSAFMSMAKERGHEVVCVTMRYPGESVELPCQIIYTSRRAKARHCAENNIVIDIWIDDMPHTLFHGAE